MTDYRARFGPHNPDETYVAHSIAEQLVDLGEITMNYATAGDPSSPALLLIPGQTESWWGYEAAIPRLAERFGEPHRDRQGVGLVHDVLDQHRELVTAQACGGIGWTEDGRHAVGGRDQDLVAAGQQSIDQVRADEPRAACDQCLHSAADPKGIGARQACGVAEPPCYSRPPRGHL